MRQVKDPVAQISRESLRNSRILKVSVSEWIACVHVHIRVRKTPLVRKTSPIGKFSPVGMRSPVMILGARVRRLAHM